MEMKDLEPARKAQVYALVAWNGKTIEEAVDMVTNHSYDEIDEITYSKDSIQTAIDALDMIEIHMYSSKKYSYVIEAIDSIHKNWVTNNAKKYKRDKDFPNSQEKSKKMLFQHLPTALIGIEELAKDLMFIAPFLERFNINVGEMENSPYGKFIPSEEIVTAYNEFAEKYKYKNVIVDQNSLINHILKVVKIYDPLQVYSEDGTQRKKYMEENVELLADQVQEKNPDVFTFGLSVD